VKSSDPTSKKSVKICTVLNIILCAHQLVKNGFTLCFGLARPFDVWYQIVFLTKGEGIDKKLDIFNIIKVDVILENSDDLEEGVAAPRSPTLYSNMCTPVTGDISAAGNRGAK